MKFAIRDDDTSFFTKPEELLRAYDFVEKGPVSLSVVPFAVPHHEKGVLPYGEGIPFGYYPIGDAPEIVAFLKDSDFDLMLHGYSHEYRQIGGQWYPEMLWKDAGRILEELREGKAYLEGLFGRPFRVFIAPNNAVDSRAIRAVEALGMDFSGIIRHRDRDFSLPYARCYLRRWTYRALSGLRIPDVLDYGKHRELAPFPLDDLDMLKREYQAAKKRGAPFTVYTHYWQLNRDAGLKTLLREIYTYAMEDGAELTALSACFRRDGEARR